MSAPADPRSLKTKAGAMFSSSLEDDMPQYSLSGIKSKKRRRKLGVKALDAPGATRAHVFPVAAAITLLEKLGLERGLSDTARKILKQHQIKHADEEGRSSSDGSTGGTATVPARYVRDGISDRIPYIVIPTKIEEAINRLIQDYARERSILTSSSETLAQVLGEKKSEKLRTSREELQRLALEKMMIGESLKKELTEEERSSLEARLRSAEEQIEENKKRTESLALSSPIFRCNDSNLI